MQTLAVLLVGLFFTSLLVGIARSWSRLPPTHRPLPLDVRPPASTPRDQLMARVIDNHRR